MAFSIDAFDSILAHWSAESITGLSNAANVTTQPDTGPHGCTLTGSAGNYPTYIASAKNGLPGIAFNGTNSRLTSTVALPTTGVANLGFSMVLRLPTVPKVFDGFFNLHANSPGTGSNYAVFAGGGLIYCPERPSYYQSLNTFPSAGSWIVLDGVLGEQFAIRNVDGKSSGTNVGNPPGVFSGNLKPTIGNSYSASQFGEFDLCELVLFDQTELSESVWITGHLAHKYAITLDAKHPFYAAGPTTQPGASAGGVRSVNIRGGADQ